MKSVFERRDDCPLVESLIWGYVAQEYGDFSGIQELSFADLLALRSAVDHQLQQVVSAGEQEA